MNLHSALHLSSFCVLATVVTAPADESLTAAQRQELEKQVVAKVAEAKQAEEAEDFAKACTARQAALDLRIRLHGEKDWRVTSARLDLADVDLLAKLSPEERRQVAIGWKFIKQTQQLSKQFKYDEAVETARQALKAWQEVLGEDHRSTVLACNWLGYNLDNQGQYVVAPRSQGSNQFGNRSPLEPGAAAIGRS